MRKRVEEQLKGLPAKPGVYLFRGERGEMLYIGKAKSLRPRVRSYFQAGGESRATIAGQVGGGSNFTGLGISYRFGSSFNNFVNPRFTNGR